MQDRPTAIELLEAVRQHLTDQVLPAIQAPRLRYQTLVAANVLAITARELAATDEHTRLEWERLTRLLGHQGEMPVAVAARREEIAALNRRLCHQIDAGDFDRPDKWQQLLAHCQTTAREKVAVSNPRFLQRVIEAE